MSFSFLCFSLVFISWVRVVRWFGFLILLFCVCLWWCCLGLFGFVFICFWARPVGRACFRWYLWSVCGVRFSCCLEKIFGGGWVDVVMGIFGGGVWYG